jgi:hypothetical protein
MVDITSNQSRFFREGLRDRLIINYFISKIYCFLFNDKILLDSGSDFLWSLLHECGNFPNGKDLTWVACTLIASQLKLAIFDRRLISLSLT